MITSNHKKLVNACYPITLNKHNPSHLVSPEPNSLSKLVYYCSTQPHKIHKITAYLLSYAQAQALPASFSSSFSTYRHSKPGLICTIKIFKALLENCESHLRLLAPHLNPLIAIGLGLIHRSFQSPPSTSTRAPPPNDKPGFFGDQWVSQDLDITLSTIDLFSQYARSIHFDCLQDHQLSRNFLFFLAKFSSIAMVCPPTSPLTKSITTGQQPLKPKWGRCMALMALESTTQAPHMYSSSYFDRQIRMIIPGLMAAICPSPQRNPDELLTLIHQARLDSPHQPTSHVSSTSPNELIQQIKDLRSIVCPQSASTESDLINYSIKTLNFLLSVQLTHSNQFEICLNAILNQLESTIISEELSPYYDWFGQSLLNWSIPKHRSIVVDLVVHRLTSIQLENPTEHEIREKSSIEIPKLATGRHGQQYHIKKLIVFASMLKAMLRDPAASSIQLLNTLNISHQVLRLIQSILEEPRSLRNEELQQPRDLLVDVIGSLASTVYYDEQINDLCKDLLGRIRTIVTQTPSSPNTVAVTCSFEPMFVVALFDCLDRVLINANSCRTTSESTPTPSKIEHRAVSLVLWKDSISILVDLPLGSGCRSGFFKALTSFLRLEAFTEQQTSKTTRVQQLGQFLSSFNALVYRLLTESNPSSSPETDTPRNVIDSVPEIPLQPDVGQSNVNGHQPSGSTSAEITSNRVDAACLGDCLIKIFAHQHQSSLLVCLPMLRELDRALASKSIRGNTQTDKIDPLLTNTNATHEIFLDCLETIGKAWGIPEIYRNNSSLIVPTQQQEGSGESGAKTKSIQWDHVLERVCDCPIFQEKSGMIKQDLLSHFEKRWRMEEDSSVSGGWSASAIQAPRRGSMKMAKLTPRRDRVRELSGMTSLPDLQAGAGGMGRSSQANVSGAGGSPSGSVAEGLGAKAFPSVADLRRCLLGAGFLPMGDTSSGHSSFFRDSSASATTRRRESCAEFQYLNHSTGDLGPRPTASEFGVLHPWRGALAAAGPTLRSPTRTATTARTSKTATLSSDEHDGRRSSLARRKTLTAEVLDKSKRAAARRPPVPLDHPALFPNPVP